MTKQWIEITRERANQAANEIIGCYGETGRTLYYDTIKGVFYTSPFSEGDIEGVRLVMTDACNPETWGDDDYNADVERGYRYADGDSDYIPPRSKAQEIANAIYWDCKDDIEAKINEAE